MTEKEIQKKKNPFLENLFSKSYKNQVKAYFGNDKKSEKFLSSVVAAVQRNPDLGKCEPTSLLNSFMMMAQLEFMPSDVSGEAYVIPYKKDGVSIAQFQLGYQGLVTLFYRAGAQSITSEIIRETDEFEFVNGRVNHRPDILSEDRGEARGAYVIIELKDGGAVHKVMSKKEIIEIGETFSKTYNNKDSKFSFYSPWNSKKNDPQLWMWKKTVLKQCAKLVPKNKEIVEAIAEDNKESKIDKGRENRIDDRVKEAIENSDELKMGNIKVKDEESKNKEEEKLEVIE